MLTFTGATWYMYMYLATNIQSCIYNSVGFLYYTQYSIQHLLLPSNTTVYIHNFKSMLLNKTDYYSLT